MNASPAVWISYADADGREMLSQAIISAPRSLRLELFHSAAEVLQKLQSTPAPDMPSLLMLEQRSGNPEDRDVLSRIRSSAETSHIPVIVLSVEDDREKRALLSGGASFVLIPSPQADAFRDQVHNICNLWLHSPVMERV